MKERVRDDENRGKADRMMMMMTGRRMTAHEKVILLSILHLRSWEVSQNLLLYCTDAMNTRVILRQEQIRSLSRPSLSVLIPCHVIKRSDNLNASAAPYLFFFFFFPSTYTVT